MQPDMDRDAAAREQARRRQHRAERVQRRRMAFGIIFLGLIVLVIALVVYFSGNGHSSSTTSSTATGSTDTLESASYSAKLSGANSVPKVTTRATGEFTLTYDSAKKQLSYGLDIANLTKPNVAAIYEGAPGAAGTVVYTLPITNASASAGVFNGTLCDGVVKAPDFIGSLQGKTIADLIKMIKDGNAYVSVGTPTHPIDAIRGPITD
jgi:hypothetical protein